MLGTIVIFVLAVIAVIVGLAAMRPNTFRVQREADIEAPPGKIFALIADFHQWTRWSPWEKMDPALSRSYSGAASGEGAVYSWVGNKKVGQGRMEIVEAVPPSRLRIKLDFLKPFEAHNITDFSLHEKNGSTHVTWAMHGETPFLFKVLHLFFNMDRMVGKDFEAGLAALKAEAEGREPIPIAAR